MPARPNALGQPKADHVGEQATMVAKRFGVSVDEITRDESLCRNKQIQKMMVCQIQNIASALLS